VEYFFKGSFFLMQNFTLSAFVALVLGVALCLGGEGFSAPHAVVPPAIAAPENRLYEAVADNVYLQEIGTQIVTTQPVTALAVYDQTLYAVLDGILHTLQDGRLKPLDEAPRGMRRLFVLAGALWGTTSEGVYRFMDGKLTRVFDHPMVDLCIHRGHVYGATRDDVYRFEEDGPVNIMPQRGWLSSDSTVVMADGSQVLVNPVSIGPIRRIASYSGTLYLLRSDGLALLDGDVLQSQPVDWGMLPSDRLRDMRAAGSQLLISTDRGVAVLRGAALTTLTGREGLPYEDTTCLAPGFAGDLWIGTTTGAIRKVGKMGREYHYFGAHQWLPGDHVHDLAIADKTVYIATDKGIGVIRYVPYTLRKKAAYFEQNLETWGYKRLGFVHKLYWSSEENAWLREISDNDGGHTSHYLAAMCYKYAVTQDAADRLAAVDAFAAMHWLQTITGTDGFIARAIWAVGVDRGQRSTQGSGGLPAKWIATQNGLWQWKGDTSSDEVNSHFFAVSLFHDLVARGREKKLARDHLTGIARHILDNGWMLRDRDGQPTRWGRWDPDYLLRPYGFESRGLNGMEAQTYMWTALRLSGNPVFRQGLDQLVQWRYPSYTVREKITFPPENVVPWDDELAFRCFHPLITYCDDPHLRSIYLRALARHWEVMRIQHVPFYNYSYGGLTGNDCESAAAARHLREWSLDTVSHSYRNSHRADLAIEPGYTPYMGGTRAISPRELVCMWGSRSALRYNGGDSGHTVTPPVGWLEDYWMGRFYGMIHAPTTTDSQLLTVPAAAAGKLQGAAPYAGPPRPDVMAQDWQYAPSR